jgi:hypothetical protein
MSWPFTRFGEYIVASGYNLARSGKIYMDRSKLGGGVSSITEADGMLSKKLWATKALAKMKINLWRFAYDCLSTGVAL